MLSPTSRFRVAGVVDARDLLVVLMLHGSRDEALPMRIDHKLFRAYVAFRYFDAHNLETRKVPTGLVVEATTKADALVGAGTAVTEDGVVYVLHSRIQERSYDLFYRFRTEAPLTTVHNRVFEEPFPAHTLAVDTVSSVTRLDHLHYPLPLAWHSKGWQGRIVDRVPWPEELPDPTDPTPPDDIRTDTTALTAPLTFHLDDTVLVDKNKKPITIGPNDHVTLFDNRLAVKNPVPLLGHISLFELDDNYLAGERDIVPASNKLEEMTRLIDFDGKLHDVIHERVTGTMNQTRALGARAAVADDHPLADFSSGAKELMQTFGGSFELHLIDTPFRSFPYPLHGPTQYVGPLHHLLVYWSATILGIPMRLRNYLAPAARRWVRAHPAFADSAGFLHADALIPRGTPSAGDPVVLIRYFFGERKTPKFGKPRIRVREKFVGGQRGHFDPNTKTIELEFANLHNEETVAHEGGHVLNLPDEYGESLPDTELLSTNQRQDGSSRVKAYLRDARALMNFNYKPPTTSILPTRLRYFWHHAHTPNNHAPFQAALGNKTFLPEVADVRGTGRMRYELPAVPAAVLASETDKSPWVHLGEARPSASHVRAFVFRLGVDLGPARYQFGDFWGKAMTMGGDPFVPNGIMWLRLAVRMAGLRLKDRQQAALMILRLVTQTAWMEYSMLPMFMVTTDASAVLQRVAVDWQPWFSVNGEPGPTDLQIRLLDPSSTTPHPLLQPAASRPAVLSLRAADINPSLLRHALGVATTDTTSNLITTPLTTAEVQASTLGATLARILHEPVSVSRNVVQLQDDQTVK